MSATRETATGAASASEAPRNAGLVLTSLILVAAVANLNLSVANVALPSIDTSGFDPAKTLAETLRTHLETRARGVAECRRGAAGSTG